MSDITLPIGIPPAQYKHPSLYKRREQIRADWLKSYHAGWSIAVCCTHARCYEAAFRAIFADDAEIQEIFKVNKKAKQEKLRGV